MQRILILLVFVCAYSANAQIKAKLYVDGKMDDRIDFKDSIRFTNHLTNLQLRWLNDGHYFSGIDSLIEKDASIGVYLYKGESWEVNLPEFQGKKLPKYLNARLKDFANNGYPFASVFLDSTRISEGTLTGKLMINPGPEIRYDSAYFFAAPKTNKSYIFQLLDIVPDEPFSEKDYTFISQKIERSSFLSIERPTDLSFKKNKAKVFLDIKESASSSFQGVLGLQQVQAGKTVAVGSIDLDLQNLFRSGKQFKLGWERFSEESQRLNIFYKHPFFLESKLAPSFRFDLLKQDTTFITRKTGLGIHTYISPRSELFAEFERTTGTLLSTDLESISNSGLADFTRNVYGLQLTKGRQASLNSLRNGVVWNTGISAGRKSINKNLNLPDSYYDTIQSETNFYQLEAGLTYQKRVLKRQTLFHRLESGFLQNEELLTNELYRLGGINSIRGFNEKSIFASQYVLSRFEFRSFFENSSYAYVFYDQLVYKNRNISDQPYGLGFGFALATSAGQFSFALGVGDSKTQAISFSTMKVHFGYISKF